MSRRLQSAAAVLILGTAALATGLAQAHHSTAMFEWGKEVKMENVTVDRWDWTNPHTFLYVTNAKGEKWAFEGMSPNHLGRSGWTKRTLNPGDKVTLGYYPLKDGRKGGFDVGVTWPNGKTMRQLNSPADDPSKAR